MAINPWILATRPKTLPASLCPVGIGLWLSYAHGAFHWPYALATALCALCIQIGTNFANDYIDFQKGADRSTRKGPKRMVQSGYISEKQMKYATALVFFCAFLFGIFTVIRGGWPILCLGLISIGCGYWYTSGPYALAYIGLGELFAGTFFGPVAVLGTYYIQHQTLHSDCLWLGLGLGFISVALLAVNNVRDYDEDTLSNKKTLVVRFGRTFGIAEYIVSMCLSTLILAYFTYSHSLLGYSWTIYAMYCLYAIRFIRSAQVEALNRCLALTGVSLVLFSSLYCITQWIQFIQ